MFRLDNKVAIITGGYRGIGRSIGVKLASQGAHVVLGDVGDEGVGKEALAAIEQAGGKGELVRLDVTSSASVEEVFKDVHKRLGRIDILVNNAGIARDQLLMRVSEEDIQKTYAVNVTGSILCAQAAIRPMMRAKTGRIINLASVVAELGNPGQAAYSSSKAALIGLTKTLSREYASRCITVNAVAPGYVATAMTAATATRVGATPEDHQRLAAQNTPLRRVARPEEIASVVAFLASDDASYLTGQTIYPDGGRLALNYTVPVAD